MDENVKKKTDPMDFINNIRRDLLSLRISKTQKKKFEVSKYRKKRKLLARLLTQINK